MCNHYIINNLYELLNFKPMKKNFFILMIIFTSTLAAQVVNIADGNNIIIANGATLDIAGLELTPNADYTIVGENSVSKESEVITINGNESMSKSYTAGVSLKFEWRIQN